MSSSIQRVPRGYKVALRNAMREDGWPESTPANYCDISAACRAGFILSAAHLLLGATECPNLDAFLCERGPIPKGEDGWPVDWPEWSAWFHANTAQCPKCEAFVFTDDGRPDTCGNCLADIPEEECEHVPAARVVPALGSPLPTCAKCGTVYMD
jgi:hypothetical protein